ncbi:MAG TPA: antitoxin Xre/MbcA/ParS toxin-binding domain-containing protein [Caulobacteraceae bacterium]
MAQPHPKTAAAGARKARTAPSALHAPDLAGTTYVARFMDKAGLVEVEKVAQAFRMSRGQIAQTAGLGLATLSKAARRAAPRAQARVTELLEIIARVRDWAGGEAQAMAWYRAQPIPALDGRTAEALVKSGRAGAVREYLDHLALGGFA